MKKLRISTVMTVVFGWTVIGWAADQAPAPTDSKTQASATEKAQAAATAPAVPASVKTDHSFEDLLIQGKYHFSDEAVTTVEEDKVLDSLLGVRTDFKDKIEQSVGRY